MFSGSNMVVLFLIATVVLFVGLMGVLGQDVSNVNYNSYLNESLDSNYTNATGSYADLPKGYNLLTWANFLTHLGDYFPNIYGLNWFFTALIVILSVAVIITFIRGSG